MIVDDFFSLLRFKQQFVSTEIVEIIHSLCRIGLIEKKGQNEPEGDAT
jgi:hypothetical protein